MEKKNLIFNLADSIGKKVFKLSLNLPQRLQFLLGEQIRRASLSIVLNIVEGGARVSETEKKQFLNFSFDSLKETKYLLYFAKNLDLIGEKRF